MNNIKKIRDFFYDNTGKMQKRDYIILGIMLFIYGIISFINLGSLKNPQTFQKFNHSDSAIVKIGEEPKMVSKIRHYTGEDGGSYMIMGSNDNQDYHEITKFKDESVFIWSDTPINEKVKYIKIVSISDEKYIGEMMLYNESEEKLQVTAETETAKLLIDEPNSVPDKISYLNGTYFDEIYFPRTAYDYANGMVAYEWVHPPLGKLIQMVPILFLGMTTFAYRLMGNIAGILMIAVMYIFAKSLFKSRKYAFLAGTLMMFDNFHFAQTRIGTVDSFLVLFMIVSAFFMFQYIQLNKEDSLKKKNKYLFFSGLFFGLATSVKWTGMYLGMGLCIIFFGKLIVDSIKEKRIDKQYIKIIPACVLYFVIIPIIIYALSYFLFPNVTPSRVSNCVELVEQTKRVYQYHSTLVAEHSFTSKWYTWPIMLRPVWYYTSAETAGLEAGFRSTITSIGNPAIWWVGMIASIVVLLKAGYSRKKEDIFIIVMMLSMWLPYVFIGRIMFLYHFFPALPFMMLAIVAFVKWLEGLGKQEKNWLTIGYILLFVVMFAIFYPVSSGMPVSEQYIQSLRWLDTWYF